MDKKKRSMRIKKNFFKDNGIEPFMVFRSKACVDDKDYFTSIGMPYKKGHFYWVVLNIFQERRQQVASFVCLSLRAQIISTRSNTDRFWIEELLRTYDMVYKGRSASDAIAFCEQRDDKEVVG